jgi:hypothetical protein
MIKQMNEESRQKLLPAFWFKITFLQKLFWIPQNCPLHQNRQV